VNFVSLRPISTDDAEAITRLLEGDTDLALWTATIPIPYTIEHARTFLKTADPRQNFTILAGNELVGTTGFKDESGTVEIGYWIGRPYWGRGYATRAVGLLVEEARRRGIARLTAEVFPDNFPSLRVLEKCGFVRRGMVERNFPQRGGLRPVIRFELSLSSPTAC
jgi:RimJ/RimL family protein N-acetyltransferase